MVSQTNNFDVVIEGDIEKFLIVSLLCHPMIAATVINITGRINLQCTLPEFCIRKWCFRHVFSPNQFAAFFSAKLK